MLLADLISLAIDMAAEIRFRGSSLPPVYDMNEAADVILLRHASAWLRMLSYEESISRPVANRSVWSGLVVHMVWEYAMSVGSDRPLWLGLAPRDIGNGASVGASVLVLVVCDARGADSSFLDWSIARMHGNWGLRFISNVFWELQAIFGRMLDLALVPSKNVQLNFSLSSVCEVAFVDCAGECAGHSRVLRMRGGAGLSLIHI